VRCVEGVQRWPFSECADCLSWLILWAGATAMGRPQWVTGDERMTVAVRMCDSVIVADAA